MKIILSVLIVVLVVIFTVMAIDIIPIGNEVNGSSGIQAYEVNIIYLSCIESWSCGTWSNCNSSEKQARTCTDANGCQTTGSRPIIEQNCTLAEGGGGIGKFIVDPTNRTAEEVSTVGDIIKLELDQTRKAILYSTIFIVFMILLGLAVTKRKDIDIRKFLKR